MKIFLSNLNESWVVDRFREDWYTHNSNISTNDINSSDIIWIISPWVWNKLPKKYLKSKKVVCSIYHIDFDKFDSKEQKDFNKRDQFVDFYHVISQHTKKQLETLTDKKIISIPFWVDQNIFYNLQNKDEIKSYFGFDAKDFLIGSFQRDSEGRNVSLPKLIKGPDIFIKIVSNLSKKNKDLKVVLTGKRRDYIKNELLKLDIPFSYFEMVSTSELNKLYNVLDLYIVSSRLEGGPQAIMECAINKTPIISTNVGIAPEILSSKSLYNNQDDFYLATPDVEYAYKKSLEYTIPNGMNKFIKMFKESYES